ncbi:MAG: hypothetical protein LBB35_02065, partial [Coriobacteriaceae bacterium]|nr:hypothetical protein [Coriobacteriaceae bacterium]
MEQSDDFKRAILNFLMRRHAGASRGQVIPQEEIDLILRYHQELRLRRRGFFKNAAKLFQCTGQYASELEAALSQAPEMRHMTDSSNREVAVIIATKKKTETINGKKIKTTTYVTSGIVVGMPRNVVAIALAGSVWGLVARLTPARRVHALVHTHPHSETSEANIFSGNPANLREFGDVSVTELLGYKSIYLVGADGSLKQFEGRG